MSNKTIKQRIALVALSALGAGLLSVVPVSSANATANAAPGDTTIAFAEDVLRIGTTLNATGEAVVTADTNLSSTGLVAVSDIAGTRVAGTTQTAILLSTGTLAVGSLTGSGDYGVITVEGGTISKGAGTDAVNSTNTTVVQTTASTAYSVLIRPSSGVTTMTVRAYSAAAAAYGSSAATALASPTLGTLFGQITVTISSASLAGVMSPALSALYYATSASPQSLTTDSLVNTGSQVNGGLGCVNIQLNDGYGQDVTTTAGLLTATATNNAIVNLHASACNAGTTVGSTFLSAASPANVVLSVRQPVAGVALSTVVTVSFNGVVVGTKSFTFAGKMAKMTVSKPKIGALNGTSADLAVVKFEDAAGNTIYPASDSTAYPLNSNTLAITAATATSVVSSAGISTTVPVASTGETGKISWSCGAVAGTSKISLAYVNTDGSVVTSNVFDAACAGNVYGYSASFDKASYAPGEVATLSVKFTDINGNLTNDYNAFVTGTPAASNVDALISVGGALTAVTAPTAADRTTNGVKKYTYTVGSTTGSFNAIVSFTIDDAVTVPFTVKASGTNVTNEDILKSIVSLIASINKQIQALQKLILKR